MCDKVGWLIDNAASGVVKAIMEADACTMPEAMEAFFSTRTFEALQDPETGLYLESPSHLYEMQRAERQSG